MGSFCIFFFDTGKRRFSKIEVCQRWHQERFSVQLVCVFQWDRQTDVLENYKCGSSGAQQSGKSKKGNVSKCTLRGEKGFTEPKPDTLWPVLSLFILFIIGGIIKCRIGNINLNISTTRFKFSLYLA